MIKPEIIGAGTLGVAVLYPIAKVATNWVIKTITYWGKTDEHEKYINRAREHTDGGRAYDRAD